VRGCPDNTRADHADDRTPPLDRARGTGSSISSASPGNDLFGELALDAAAAIERSPSRLAQRHRGLPDCEPMILATANANAGAHGRCE